MFKSKLFYIPLLAVFLLLPNYLKSADRVSGGQVIFDDIAGAPNTGQVPLPGQRVGAAGEEGISADAQVNNTKEEIKQNLKRNKREAILDATTMFKPDTEQNLYGINMLVLKINVKRDKTGRVLGLLPEGQEQPTTFINLRNSPEHFLDLATNDVQRTDYSNADLYSSHKELLRSFVSRVPKDQDAIIIMYVNGSNLKTMFDREMKLEKTIYAQAVTDFLYRNKRRLIIERRYVDDIPENEIFMIISRFEGNIPVNVFNASKGNILQWLARYKELERQNVLAANNSRTDLENSLNSTTSTKSPAFLQTTAEREVRRDDTIMRVDESNLFQNTRNVQARPNPNGENGGPRRVAPRPVEEPAQDGVSEADIQADENAQLNQENAASEAEGSAALPAITAPANPNAGAPVAGSGGATAQP
ncbi:MAG: hypothetical protein LBQ34_04610 [Alphaproteobacteria bacterium]|jgi:hypothetical protein|nr:hypothetical protein [Alphaproteobacteria bacterium]